VEPEKEREMNPLDLTSHAPWRQRFRAASIAWAEVASGCPLRGLVCSNKDGIYQLYAWDVVTGMLSRLTDERAGVVSGIISPDGNYIYFLKDSGGNEIGHYARLPFLGGKLEDITPNLAPYAATSLQHSQAGCVIGFITAGQEGFTAYVLCPGDPPRPVYKSQHACRGPVLSQAGELMVVASTDRSGTLDFSLLAFDVDSGRQVAELWDGEHSSVEPGDFSPLPSDLRMLATTSRSGYERPLIWNPATGERRELRLDAVPGSVVPFGWTPDAARVLLCQLNQAQYQLYLYDLASDRVTRLAHPAGVVGGGIYFSPEGELWLTWQDPAHPARLVALDAASGAQRRTLLSAGEAPAGSAFHSFEFHSENGDLVQGWLATPALGEGPYPTILHTHGGPTHFQSLGYFPAAQAWLDHGFALCSINYHGSTTFGKLFEKSIWGNLGDLEVQDMAAACRWLVEQKIADPQAIFATGGSYGGYLTLQALGRRPELWAGGMAVVAIADWELVYEDQAETLRGYQRALFGGTPQDVPEATVKSSPITYAAQVRAPIMVIQGENDTRCPARQMKAYEQRLQELGKEIRIHWFDAGHGSRAQEQQIEQQEMMLKFAYRILGETRGNLKK
jgi:dipeptidyl aminopeptidase/acylaminoacyl peptidase